MAETTNRITIISLISTGVGTSNDGVYSCRYLGGAYGDPNAGFVAGTNEWYYLTEDAGTIYGYFYGDIPKGKYRHVVKNDAAIPATYSEVAYYTNVHHSTLDFDNHINDDATDMRHDHDAIVIESGDVARYGATLDVALDAIAGATWTSATDDSLEEHIDHGTAPASLAHTDDAIEATLGGTVEDVLDDHNTRISALETGTATTPAGIADYTGDLGIDVEWTPQDVRGIEYAVKYLWKHIGETVPATHADLTHLRAIQAPETLITFRSRRFDLSSSPDTELVLYYAIAARGRADAAWTWTTVENINVTLPVFTQEYSGVLTGLSVCGSSSPGIYNLDSIDIGSDEVFPTATEVAGVPTADFIEVPFLSHNVTISAIEIYSGTAMSGDCTMKYDSTSGSLSGSFLVSQTTQRGASGTIAIPVTIGDELRIWTTAPEGISHYRIKIWFYVG